jgi:hypothetical protein
LKRKAAKSKANLTTATIKKKEANKLLQAIEKNKHEQ